MNLHHDLPSAGCLPRRPEQAQRILVAGIVLTLLALSSVATAIPIGDGSNGPFTFDTQPVVADWTQRTIAGAAGSPADLAAMTALVQQQTATGINAALAADATASPTINANSVRWNSALHALETGPTGVAAGFLMGKFVNSSPNYITDFLVTYDVGSFPTPPTAETMTGHAVYYSTTGLANSWVPVDDGSGTNNVYGGAGGSTFFFVNGLGHNWGNNPLYILWADDNGPPSDAVFTVDNMFMETALGDLKDPPPPPTPVFGNISPPQLQNFETPGTGFAVNNTGGTLTTVAGSQGLQINSGAITANPDQVDLRGVAAGSQKLVSMDLKAWENSAGSDFEAADHITVTADISEDGLTFSTITLLDLHGAPILSPFDPTVPNPADMLRATFGPTEAVNNADQPWVHFDLPLPSNAKTVLVHVDMGNDSTSEFMAIDNISVRAVAVPEPASLALFGLGAVGLVGYGVRRRRAA